MIKRFLLLIVLLLLCYLTFQYIRANRSVNVSNSCLNDSIIDLSTIKIDSTYNFDENFNCKEWDEILIIASGSQFNKTIFSLRTGIALPEGDYINVPDSFCFLFFLKDDKVVSQPILFGDDNFIFSQNLNRYGYLRLDRKDAVFRYVKFDNDHFELYTFEVIK